jgi:hypothetical protein
MCARVGNQRSHGVVTAQIQTDVVRSLCHQRRDLHQSTYPVPIERSGLILLSPHADVAMPPHRVTLPSHGAKTSSLPPLYLPTTLRPVTSLLGPPDSHPPLL